AHLEHELDDLGGLDGHLLRQFRNGDGLADGHVTHDRAARAVEAMLVALLQAALATTTTATETLALVVGIARRDARGRALALEGRALRFLAVATLVVVPGTLGATRFFLLALLAGSGGRRLGDAVDRGDLGSGALLLRFQ